MPRSPRAARPTQLTYWATSGRSRWSSLRWAATSLGVGVRARLRSAATNAGSPGVALARPNVRMEIPKSVGIISSTRRSTKRRTSGDPRLGRDAHRVPADVQERRVRDEALDLLVQPVDPVDPGQRDAHGLHVDELVHGLG